MFVASKSTHTYTHTHKDSRTNTHTDTHTHIHTYHTQLYSVIIGRISHGLGHFTLLNVGVLNTNGFMCSYVYLALVIIWCPFAEYSHRTSVFSQMEMKFSKFNPLFHHIFTTFTLRTELRLNGTNVDL